MFQFDLVHDIPLSLARVIDADDPFLHAWLSDMEFVDTAIPKPFDHDAVFDTVEIDAIACLRYRINTPHQEN